MDFRRPVEAVVGGVQGRLLAVLVEVTAPLTLRTLARLAEVSPAQASRVLPRLVDLGIVERHEVPPASQFVLARENIAAQTIVALAEVRERALRQIGKAASSIIRPVPIAVIAFGSLARGEADGESDIDLLVVRHDDVDEDSDQWSESLERWRRRVRALTGNDVEVLESSASEAAAKLRGRSELWRDIKRDGVVVHGAGLDVLLEQAVA